MTKNTQIHKGVKYFSNQLYSAIFDNGINSGIMTIHDNSMTVSYDNCGVFVLNRKSHHSSNRNAVKRDFTEIRTQAKNLQGIRSSVTRESCVSTLRVETYPLFFV